MKLRWLIFRYVHLTVSGQWFHYEKADLAVFKQGKP